MRRQICTVVLADADIIRHIEKRYCFTPHIEMILCQNNHNKIEDAIWQDPFGLYIAVSGPKGLQSSGGTLEDGECD